MKKMSGLAISGIIIAAVIFILGAWGIGSYNGLVGLKENIENQSANIDVQLQRRVDLILNLVSTVKGMTTHESDILAQISNARAKLAGASSMSDKSSADAELSGALSRLLVVVENYPNIKSNEQFTALMDELAGTESRIAYARKGYNDVVTEYNSRIKTFPANVIAGIFGFTPADYFKSSSESTQVPSVSFS